MADYERRIARLEAKMAQERARLNDLKAQKNREERRNDTRRKILLGAAFEAMVETFEASRRKKSFEKLHEFIRRDRDREFLGLEPLPEADDAPKSETPAQPKRHRQADADGIEERTSGKTDEDDPETPNLPFG